MFASGNIAKGNFKEDLLNGYGIFTWVDGSKYKGQFKKGLKSGKGKYTDIEGDSYEGDWDEEEIFLRRVAFHPSGVSTPFIARLRTGFGNNKEKTFRFDPFSGYPRFTLEDEW